MLAIINATLAVFLVICLGQALRRMAFLNPESWPQLDRLTYFVLMPSLLLNSIAKADFSQLELLPFIGTLLLSVLTMIGALIVFRPALGLSGPRFASFFQATTRWNGFVALATLVAVYGQPALGPAGMTFAVMVPVLNIASVIVLARNAGDTPPGIERILYLLSRNPLILACFAGVVLNATGIGLPGPIGGFFELLARAALAVGLVGVGAALNLNALRSASFHLGLACGLKLIVMPVIMLSWCLVFGISGIALSVAVVAGSVPTATASFVLARQLGGDAEFMASLITATTLASAVTMPIMISLLT